MKRNLLLAVGSVLFTYLIFELFFAMIGLSPYRGGRVAKFQWISQDPIRGWVNRPGFVHDAFSIDRNGFRTVDPPSNAKETIFCMGDSGTFGTWDDGTWSRFPDFPSILQRLVDPQKIRIVNSGVIGYTSSHLLRQYMVQIRKLKPSRIIIRVGFNDHSPAWDVRKAVREPVQSWKRMLIYKLHPTFTVQTAVVLSNAVRSLPTQIEPWNSIEQFDFHLQTLIKNARADAVQVILVDYPIRPTSFPGRQDGKEFPEKIWGVKDHKELNALHNHYAEEIHALAKRLGVPIVKTADRLENPSLRGFESTDIVHPAPGGYQIIAQSIAEYLNSHPLSGNGDRPE